MIKLPANTPKELLQQIATQVKDKNHFRSDGSGGYEVSEQVYNQIKQHIPEQQAAPAAAAAPQREDRDSTTGLLNSPVTWGLVLTALMFMAKEGCFNTLGNIFKGATRGFNKEVVDPAANVQTYEFLLEDIPVAVKQEYHPADHSSTLWVNNTQIAINPVNCSGNTPPAVLRHQKNGSTLRLIFSPAGDKCTQCDIKVKTKTGAVKGVGQWPCKQVYAY